MESGREVRSVRRMAPAGYSIGWDQSWRLRAMARISMVWRGLGAFGLGLRWRRIWERQPMLPMATKSAVVAGGVGVESGVDKAGKSGREDGTVQVAFPAF